MRVDDQRYSPTALSLVKSSVRQFITVGSTIVLKVYIPE